MHKEDDNGITMRLSQAEVELIADLREIDFGKVLIVEVEKARGKIAFMKQYWQKNKQYDN